MRTVLASIAAALAVAATLRAHERAAAAQPIMAAVVVDILEREARPRRGTVACLELALSEHVGDKRSTDPSPEFLAAAVPDGFEAVPLSVCRDVDFGYAKAPGCSEPVPLLSVAQPRWFASDFVKVEAFYQNVFASYALSRHGAMWRVDSSRFLGVQ